MIPPKVNPTNLPVILDPLKAAIPSLTNILLMTAVTMTEEANFNFSPSKANFAKLMVMASVSAKPAIKAE